MAMKVMRMTADEAVRLVGGDAIVYVSIGTETDCVTEFTRCVFHDCEDIIRRGNRIQREMDDLIDQLRILRTKRIPYQNLAVILLPRDT